MGTTPDYTTYSLTELLDARRHVNQQQWPERVESLDAEIALRSSQPADDDAGDWRLGGREAHIARLVATWWLAISALVTLVVLGVQRSQTTAGGVFFHLGFDGQLALLIALACAVAATMLWKNKSAAFATSLIALGPQIPMVASGEVGYQCVTPFTFGPWSLMGPHWTDVAVSISFPRYGAGVFAVDAAGWLALGFNIVPLIPLVLIACTEDWASRQRSSNALSVRRAFAIVGAVVALLLGVAGFGIWRIAEAMEARKDSARSYVESELSEILRSWDADALIAQMAEAPLPAEEQALRDSLAMVRASAGGFRGMELEGVVQAWWGTKTERPDASFSGWIQFQSARGEMSVTLRRVDGDWKIINLNIH